MNLVFSGSNTLQSQLSKLLATQYPQKFAKALESAAKNIVQAEAKTLCPVDTGRLRNSISERTIQTKNETYSEVFTNLEYAPYVEFGTGIRGEMSTYNKYMGSEITYRQDWQGHPAQPFLYPALKNNEQRIVDYVKRILTK